MIQKEKLIVITHQDDVEAIEAIKNAAGEDAVKVLAVSPKSLDEESLRSEILANRKLGILAVLGASIGSSSDYEKMVANVLNDPNFEAKLAKDVGELNKIIEYREPDMIELRDTKGLFDTTPWYDRFMGNGRERNHWGDKSKFKKKVTRWKKV